MVVLRLDLQQRVKAYQYTMANRFHVIIPVIVHLELIKRLVPLFMGLKSLNSIVKSVFKSIWVEHRMNNKARIRINITQELILKPYLLEAIGRRHPYRLILSG